MKKFLTFSFLLLSSFIFLFSPHPAHADTTTGLVGYWTFNGSDTNWATGKTNDLSGNGNTGILTNTSTTTSPVPGKMGQALDFFPGGADTDSCVRVPHSSSVDFGTGDFTVSTWVKSKGTDGVGQGSSYNSILAKGYAYGALVGWDLAVFISAPLVPEFDVATTTAYQTVTSFGGSLSDKKWHHLVAVRNGTTISTYFDGVLRNSSVIQAGSSVSNSANSLTIGTDDPSASTCTPVRNFYGLEDDIRLYKRALSATDIQQLYKQGQAKIAVSPNQSTSSLNSGLVGRWTFDGKDTNWNTGTTNDLSGQGHTGSLVSMSTTSTPVPGKIGQGFKFVAANSQRIDTVGTPASFPVTMSAWVNPKAGGSIGGIISSHDSSNGGYFMSVGGTTFQFTLGNVADYNFSDAVLTPGTWQLVTVTVTGNNGTATPYINGKAYTPVSIGTAQANTTYTIGDKNFGYFDGSMDDVRVYNRVLSASEILQLYKQGASTVGVTPTQTRSQSNGLVGYWTFDGRDTNWSSPTAGTTNDKSGNGNTGTLTNMSQSGSTVFGKIGQALSFGGSTAISIADSPSLHITTGGFTMSAWVYLTGLATAGIVEKDVGGVTNTSYMLFLGNSAPESVFVRAVKSGVLTTFTSTGGVPANKWTHVVGVWDGSNLKAYINGVQDVGAPVAFTGPIDTGVGTSWIGAEQAAGINTFPGILDDVRIYNRALSASEISQLYKQGLSKSR